MIAAHLRWIVVALAVQAAVASVAEAQVASRRMGVRWNGAVPHLSFSARDLVSADVRRKLESGLPQTLVMRTYAYPARGRRPIAVSARSCRVVYDLWEEVYRVQVQSETEDRSATLSSIDQVLARCLVSRSVAVGSEVEWTSLGGQSVYFAVLVELNPLSPDTVQRIRRWLARPGGRRVEGEAFFGSFVSLFVNRRIGDAERTIRFRSQAIEVPR